MTVYDLFEKAYKYRMGQSIRSKWSVNNPREYIQQSFIEATTVYSVECACNTRIMIEYCGNSTDKTIADFKGIEVLDGYWLCQYDGHTGDWNFWWHINRTGAFREYKRLYTKYFKEQEWYWIVKIGWISRHP